MLDINPEAKIEVIKQYCLPNNVEELVDSSYSYIIDAIDNVTAKVSLVEIARKI